MDTVFATSPPTISAEGEISNTDEVFDRNDSISIEERSRSNVITEERLAEMTEGIELEKLSYSELQSLAETLSCRTEKTSSSKEEWTITKSKRLDLNLDGKAGTYSRKRAAKLKQRTSWDDQSDQENLEMHEFTRLLINYLFTIKFIIVSLLLKICVILFQTYVSSHNI